VDVDIEDYFQQGRKMWFRLHAKGGKHHEVPAHHNAIVSVAAYLQAVGRNDVRGCRSFAQLLRTDKSPKQGSALAALADYQSQITRR
jgi:hypothetical protein